MKVIVTSQGQELNSPVDPRFGRAKYFLVVDTETGDFSAADNSQNLNAAQGAGIQADCTNGYRIAQARINKPTYLKILSQYFQFLSLNPSR